MNRLELGPKQHAFAEGGNRLCFIDPRDNHRVIKVLRPERSPSARRAEKKFPKNLKPLSRFDDNIEESEVMARIDRSIGEEAYEMVSKCYGFVDTNYGPGLVSELIRDSNGLISITLKQFIWENGVTDELQTVLQHFCAQWQRLGMPSRSLLLHNIVVQQGKSGIQRLVVIDGLGWAGLMRIAYTLRALARYKAGQKARALYGAIEQLLHKKSHNLNYGYHGWLTEEKRQLS